MAIEQDLPTDPSNDTTLARLEDQIGWYDRKSSQDRRWHMRFKIATLLSAAAIPFISGLGAQPFVIGGLGVLIVIFEGLQQLFQFHDHWVSYRGTCESLKREKFLFLALAGPYASVSHPRRLLAERIEALVATEHARWVAEQEQTTKPQAAAV